MTQVIKATGEGGCLFNAIAIGLGIEVLSGRLEHQKDSPGYQDLLTQFAAHHPNFKPKTWENFKQWLAFYNSPSDIELILAPVLFQLHQQSQDNLELETLKDQIKTDKNAFKRGNNCSELKKLTDTLSISLIENGNADSLDNRNKIHLENKDVHWNVISEDTDVDQFIGEKPLLKLTSKEAYEGIIPVPAPSGTPLVKKSSKPQTQTVSTIAKEVKDLSGDVWITTQRIDNPGRGNCAFYAFAIGLIYIIQEEKAYNNTAMFEQWIKHDPSISGLYADLCNFDYKKPNNDLLDNLQTSLRGIVYFQQLGELIKACASVKDNIRAIAENQNYLRSVEENSNFVNFAGLYFGTAADARFNPFAASPIITNKIIELREAVEIEIALTQVDIPDFNENDANMLERRKIVELFVSLLYGEGVGFESIDINTNPLNSPPIIQGIASIRKNYFWGTHLDLDYLAIAFNVNFHPLVNGVPRQPFKDEEGKYTVTVNNHNNAHWTTEISVVKLQSGVTPEAPTSETKKTGLFNKTSSSRVIEDREKKDPKPIDKSAVAALVSSFFPSEPVASLEGSSQEAKLSKAGIEKDTVNIEDPAPKERKSKEEQLQLLQQHVSNATSSYRKYSTNIWFSLFHRHGETGRLRAKAFDDSFNRMNSLENASELLIQFLSDDSKGNTHPHSFRTMLLHELIKTESYNPSLQVVSKYYDQLLNKLVKNLNVTLIPGIDRRIR